MEWSLYYGAYYQCHYFGDKRKSRRKWQKCPTTTTPKGIGATKIYQFIITHTKSKQPHSNKGEQAIKQEEALPY